MTSPAQPISDERLDAAIEQYEQMCSNARSFGRAAEQVARSEVGQTLELLKELKRLRHAERGPRKHQNCATCVCREEPSP